MKGKNIIQKGAAAFVILFAVFVSFFWQFIGKTNFIGESDRLNAYLNMRLGTYDAVTELGHAASWSFKMFGGFPTGSLPWMNTNSDPIAYLLNGCVRENLFPILGYLPAGFSLMACAAAFLYIREVTRSLFAATVAAVAFGLSAYSILRVAQGESLHLTTVLIPIGMLAIRWSAFNRIVPAICVLAFCMSALAAWGFLQEVSYAFLFFGAYALYNSFAYSPPRNSTLAPIAVLALASTIALLWSASRMIDVGMEFHQSLRNVSSTINNYNGFSEILRFIHEGAFGRTFGESLQAHNSVNTHEGLILASSTLMTIFVLLRVAISRPINNFYASAMLVSLVLAAIAMQFFVPFARKVGALFQVSSIWSQIHAAFAYGFSHIISAPSLLTIFFFSVILWSNRRNKSDGTTSQAVKIINRTRFDDFAFHLYSLTILLGLIVLEEGARLVHAVFLGADFSHARLSVLVVLPLCTLFAIYLVELFGDKIGDGQQNSRRNWFPNESLLYAALGGFVAWLIHGPIVDHLFPVHIFSLWIWDGRHLVPAVAIKVALTLVLLIFLFFNLRSKEIPSQKLKMLAIIVGSFVLIESVMYSHLKVSAAQTQSFPIPFRDFNFMTVNPAVLRPPNRAALSEFAEKFEVEKYRLMSIGSSKIYTDARSSHISHLWGFRTIGGYGGIPNRLAMLPWPDGGRGLRTIDIKLFGL